MSGASGTSGVVLRCPNCGTTQATSGECEACHEGNVRYYCANHSPGRWLDGPVCEECALRPARVEGPPRVPSPSPGSRSRTGGAAEPRPPLVPRPPLSRGPKPRVPGPTVDRFPPAYEELPPRGSDRGRDPTAISLEELLGALGGMRERARRGRRRERDFDRDAEIGRERADWEGGGPGFPLPGGARGRGMPAAVGCLKRLLVLAVIGAILFALAAAWFFSGVIVID